MSNSEIPSSDERQNVTVENPEKNGMSHESRTQIRVTWIQVIGAIVAAVIVAIGSYLTGLGAQQPSINLPPSVVPQNQATEVDELPVTSKNSYMVLKDISIFDLRSWTPMPDTSLRKKGRYSPMNYTNYLHIKKLKGIKEFTAHYATGGFAIDLRCITHKDTVFMEKASKHHKDALEYAVQVDISDVPVNDEILIVIEGTYWNGFTDVMTEAASTYTDSATVGLKELGLVVFLPEGKPFKTTEIYRQVGEEPRELMTHNIGTLYRDESKLFVYWNIGSITPDTHYMVKWDW